MSRSCQSATFSRPTTRVAAHDARQPADPLGHDRVALVRHRRRALLAAAERLLDLAHLGAREVADLEREALERRRRAARARSAARRGGRAGGSASSSAPARARAARRRSRSTSGSAAAYVPTAPESLPTRIPSSARATPDAVALELERPAGELEPERRRLGVDAVRAADGERVAVLLGARGDGGERALEPVQDQRARVAELQRERRVDDVGRRQAVVEPAALLAELLGDGVDEGGDVVLGLAPRSRRRARASGRVAPARIASTASRGTTPSSAQPSSAASSTSSQRASLASSDQIAAMAGRE